MQCSDLKFDSSRVLVTRTHWFVIRLHSIMSYKAIELGLMHSSLRFRFAGSMMANIRWKILPTVGRYGGRHLMLIIPEV
jgi:hypothetical protein